MQEEIKNESIDTSEESIEEKGLEEEEKYQQDSNKKEENNLEELKDKYLRLYAEFDNFRKRTLREQLELRKYGASEAVKALLPVLDDFDRAHESAMSEDTDEYFSEGVELVYHKFYKQLKEIGLKEMESTGSMFDPDLHDAISEIPVSDEEKKGIVLDTVEKGYFLNDKILRHAKVVVGR